MPLIDAGASTLVVIDLQARLTPAIDGAEAMIANTRRLLDAAKLMAVPALFTEQNPRGLGPTVPELAQDAVDPVAKMSFGAFGVPGFAERLGDRSSVVMAGCETHVCVLQTALALLQAGRRVCVVADAVGSRRAESKTAGLARMAAHGAEIVTVEMVLFEWLGTAEHPRFKDLAKLIR